jgi:anaerobic selenocysteine-containing dehydrogenase
MEICRSRRLREAERRQDCRVIPISRETLRFNGRLFGITPPDEDVRDIFAFLSDLNAPEWTDLQRASGLSLEAMIDSAKVYMATNAVIANYGMGVTQHKHGVETVKMIVNLLLLRGNIGKPGAGISPIRGHSNVQGQRTVGISEKTKLVPLERLAELYGFEPPIPQHPRFFGEIRYPAAGPRGDRHGNGLCRTKGEKVGSVALATIAGPALCGCQFGPTRSPRRSLATLGSAPARIMAGRDPT